jgi:outer membrane protein assembly factor BamB
VTELTRRRALALLGGGGAAALGGYWYETDGRCVDRRDPYWTLDGRGWSPPVTDEYATYVSEGYGYTGRDAPHRIASLSSSDGSPNWVFTEVGAGAGVPLIADDTVYVGTGRDRVYALERRTGHVEWRYDAGGRETYGGGAWGQPVALDGLVVVGVSHSGGLDPDPTDDDAFTDRVVALDAATGEEVWAREVDGMVWSGPATVGDSVVAATEAGTVYAFAVGDGTRRWRTTVGKKVWEPIFAAPDRVHAASEDGRVAALAPDSGETRWTAAVPGAACATEHDGERFLVGDREGTVVAFGRFGDDRWRFDAPAAVAAVSSAGSLAYVLDQRGIVHVLDAASGERVQRFRVAENTGERCGWIPDHEQATGLVADDGALAVTGRWVGRVRRHRESA